MQTVVKKWFRDKEFGFLDNGSGPDIMVRKADLVKCQFLKVGVTVEFECHPGKNGLTAKNVSLLQSKARNSSQSKSAPTKSAPTRSAPPRGGQGRGRQSPQPSQGANNNAGGDGVNGNRGTYGEQENQGNKQGFGGGGGAGGGKRRGTNQPYRPGVMT